MPQIDRAYIGIFVPRTLKAGLIELAAEREQTVGGLIRLAIARLVRRRERVADAAAIAPRRRRSTEKAVNE